MEKEKLPIIPTNLEDAHKLASILFAASFFHPKIFNLVKLGKLDIELVNSLYSSALDFALEKANLKDKAERNDAREIIEDVYTKLLKKKDKFFNELFKIKEESVTEDINILMKKLEKFRKDREDLIAKLEFIEEKIKRIIS